MYRQASVLATHPYLWEFEKNWLRFVAVLFLNLELSVSFFFLLFVGGNQDGKFSVGFRDGVVRTVVGLDRESQAAYTLIIEAIGGS